jgi:hypothetical protein
MPAERTPAPLPISFSAAQSPSHSIATARRSPFLSRSLRRASVSSECTQPAASSLHAVPSRPELLHRVDRLPKPRASLPSCRRARLSVYAGRAAAMVSSRRSSSGENHGPGTSKIKSPRFPSSIDGLGSPPRPRNCGPGEDATATGASWPSWPRPPVKLGHEA